MGTEIERKFLVKGTGWKDGVVGRIYRQGYLPTGDECVVRVRVAGDDGYLTIKGRNVGLTRLEFEYPIPVEEADSLLDSLCRKPIVEKTRYEVEYEGLVWEIDVFAGENEGLVTAEVELENENLEVSLPDWIDREVSDDARYFNVNLVEHPYCEWKDSDGQQE
ncbi:MAG: CYTH domain-containing protein [Proteobacteria bacterium]|nr:CYTH domain-containing protein [Pseudomonadota bacterium]